MLGTGTDFVGEDLQWGDWYWFVDKRKGRRSLVIIMPDVVIARNPYHYCIIPVTHKDTAGRSYTWDGNVRRPTIVEEIHYTYTWRGHMRAGKLVSL